MTECAYQPWKSGKAILAALERPEPLRFFDFTVPTG